MAGSYIQFVPCLLSTWCRFPMFLLWGQEDLRVFTGISKSPHIQTFFYEELIIDFFSLAIWKWAMNINFSLRHAKSSSFDFPPFLQFYDWILRLFWRCSVLGGFLLLFFLLSLGVKLAKFTHHKYIRCQTNLTFLKSNDFITVVVIFVLWERRALSLKLLSQNWLRNSKTISRFCS